MSAPPPDQMEDEKPDKEVERERDLPPIWAVLVYVALLVIVFSVLAEWMRP